MKIIAKILATTAAIGMASSALAADMTMKFGHVGAPGSLFEASVNNFAECVNSTSDGKVEVQTFGSSQLGKDKDMLQKIKLGTMHMTLPSSTMPEIAAAEVRLSERRPRWRRDAILGVLKRLETAS